QEEIYQFLEHKKNYREVTERDIEWEIRCGDWQIFIPQMVKFFNWSIDHVYYRNYPLFADHNQSHEYGGVKNAIPKKYLPDIEAFLKIRFELGMTFKKAFQKFLRQKGVRIITKIEEIRIF
ncbi:MAG: hypothetical protein M1338_05605, partial [Patescibacteria group bacterium]|nr:hypothetical protein [Patescibacteria group bacterium]